MRNNKNYRELQLSSPQVVLIFVGILLLGVIVFLLGVSVGKKQARMAQKSNLEQNQSIEQVQKEKPLPLQKSEQEQSKHTISRELASHQKNKPQSQKEETEKTSSFYYIQVGAFSDQQRAQSFAQKFEKMGYQIVIFKPFPRDKKTVYRVRLGGYSTKEEALQVKEELLEALGKKESDYFIIKY